MYSITLSAEILWKFSCLSGGHTGRSSQNTVIQNLQERLQSILTKSWLKHTKCLSNTINNNLLRTENQGITTPFSTLLALGMSSPLRLLFNSQQLWIIMTELYFMGRKEENGTVGQISLWPKLWDVQRGSVLTWYASKTPVIYLSEKTVTAANQRKRKNKHFGPSALQKSFLDCSNTSSSLSALSHSFCPGACWVHSVMSWFILSVTALGKVEETRYIFNLNYSFC